MPQLRDWLGGDLEDFDLSMIQPGVVVGPTEIPNGVSISVHRDGDGPAKITIRRGDDSWEVTEDSIDELPQDLRGTARKMLSAMSGKMLGGRRLLDFDGKIERMLPGKRLNLNAVPFQRNEENAKLKAEIESMRKEIEELRQLLKELKDNQTE